MGIFGNLFGSGDGRKQKNHVRPDDTTNAISTLHDLEHRLTKKQEHLDGKIQQELANAKRAGTKNKREALRALKRKKTFEIELNKVDGTLNTLHNQRTTLENATMNAEVLQVMARASKSMKSAHNGLNVDQIHDLLEEIADKQDVANEIAEAISNPNGQTAIDDAELLAELEQLTVSDINERTSRAPAVPSHAPAVPSHAVPVGSGKQKKTTTTTTTSNTMRRPGYAIDAEMEELRAFAE